MEIKLVLGNLANSGSPDQSGGDRSLSPQPSSLFSSIRPDKDAGWQELQM